MAKKYRLKPEYTNVSIRPSYKEIKLDFLNQEQIKILVDAGYAEYFDDESNKTKKEKPNNK